MMNVTVAGLLREGYKVGIFHKRRFLTVSWCGKTGKIRSSIRLSTLPLTIPGGDMAELLPKGGETVVELTAPDGMCYVGRARCHDRLNYDRREGVKWALNDAFHIMLAYSSKEESAL